MFAINRIFASNYGYSILEAGETPCKRQRVQVRDLRPGQVLVSNLQTRVGSVIAFAGTVLAPHLLTQIKELVRQDSLPQYVIVSSPRTTNQLVPSTDADCL